MSDESFTAETFVGNFSKSKACSLLEIVSVSTGGPFSENTSTRRFFNHTRFVFSSEYQKQLNNHFSKFPSLDELTLHIKSVKAKFDIAFVDPWHEVKDSFQVIEMALAHLHTGATLVMHDCHPRDAELRSTSVPANLQQAWSGSTWTAWSLLTQSLSDEFSWITIDADYGLGVLRVPQTNSQRRQLLRIVRSLSKQWASGSLSRPEWSADAEHLHLVEPTDPKVAAWT